MFSLLRSCSALLTRDLDGAIAGASDREQPHLKQNRSLSNEKTLVATCFDQARPSHESWSMERRIHRRGPEMLLLDVDELPKS